MTFAARARVTPDTAVSRAAARAGWPARVEHGDVDVGDVRLLTRRETVEELLARDL
jgi:hypothetical protein